MAQIEQIKPTPGSIGVSTDFLISFVIAGDIDVNPSTISITLRDSVGNEHLAMLNGQLQASEGWVSGDPPNPAIQVFGSDYIVYVANQSPFLPGVTYTVFLEAEDTGSDPINYSYSFTTKVAAISFEQGLDIYKFLAAPIREEDFREGDLFVKRYLQGPQRAWDQTTEKILSIPSLWSATEAPDEFLTYLKNIVGWTSDFDHITDRLDSKALRRLIANSGALWRQRGSESAMIDTLQFLTKARARLWNWFDFRWIVCDHESAEAGSTEPYYMDIDCTGLSEEHEGTDPWLTGWSGEYFQASVQTGILASSSDGLNVTISTGSFSAAVKSGDLFYIRTGESSGIFREILSIDGPTSLTLKTSGPIFTDESWEIITLFNPDDDERRSNIRIADNDGTLDRELVKDIIRLMRPVGERYDITYLSFLDRFDVDGDFLQWDKTLTVSGGSLKMTDDTVYEETYAIVPSSSTWSEYVYSARIKGHSNSPGSFFGIQFYRTDEDNFYSVAIDTDDDRLELRKTVAGVESVIDFVDLPAQEIAILPDIYYMIRVSVVQEGPDNRIIVFVGGSEMINTTDNSFDQGTVGLFHEAGAVLECTEVEMFQVPIDYETVEIN